MTLLSASGGGWEELGALVLAPFVTVSFPVYFDGAATWTGISPSDSEELWLPWEVDPSTLLPDLSASSTSLLEFAMSEPSLAWCSSSPGALSPELATCSSSVPLPSWDVDLLSSWPSLLDPAGDPDAAVWEHVLEAEWEQDLTRLVPGKDVDECGATELAGEAIPLGLALSEQAPP